MEQIAISKFKATCLAVLEQVRNTRKPVLVTRFGKPVAEISPPPAPAPGESWLGSLAGSMRITGDIVAPAADEKDWDALNDQTTFGHSHLDLESDRAGKTRQRGSRRARKSRK